MVLKPEGHLWEFILAIGSIPCFLCIIDVKVFGIFSIKIVHCAVELNEHEVVVEEVEFRNLEVLT